MVESLITLTLSELVEVIVPLTFLVSFVICYYGPNSQLLGNVRSSYFHYVPISNIDRFIENLFLFLGIEVVTVLTTGILLWMFCRINIIRAYLVLVKEFWLIMAIYTAHAIHLVSYYYLPAGLFTQRFIIIC